MHPTSTAGTEGGPAAELYVRSLSPTAADACQSSVLGDLRDLQERGALSDLSVAVWGDRVGLSGESYRTESAKFVLERVARFRRWASRQDRTMEPFFETRERRSSFAGEENAVLVLPVMVLAEYRNGDLVHVAPCVDGDEVRTVGDRVAALESSLAAPQPA